MKTFTITYRAWNGENGNLETRTQSGYAETYDEIQEDACDTFGAHNIVSIEEGIKLPYQTKSLEDQILTAGNMVEVEHTLANIAQFYLNEFAATVRRLNREVETQDHWLTDFRKRYGAKIKAERGRLIALIPEKFHNCTIYKNLPVS
jgi:hypothetical protein